MEILNRADQEDDVGTTAGMASLDLNELGDGELDQKTVGTTVDDDDEITEVFDNATEMDDVVDAVGINILLQHPESPQRL